MEKISLYEQNLKDIENLKNEYQSVLNKELEFQNSATDINDIAMSSQRIEDTISLIKYSISKMELSYKFLISVVPCPEDKWDNPKGNHFKNFYFTMPFGDIVIPKKCVSVKEYGEVYVSHDDYFLMDGEINFRNGSTYPCHTLNNLNGDYLVVYSFNGNDKSATVFDSKTCNPVIFDEKLGETLKDIYYVSDHNCYVLNSKYIIDGKSRKLIFEMQGGYNLYYDHIAQHFYINNKVTNTNIHFDKYGKIVNLA